MLDSVQVDRFRFEFTVTDPGWALVELGSVASSDVMSFRSSYVADSLGAFVRAVADLATESVSAADVVWYVEPAETMTRLSRAGAELMSVELLRRASGDDDWRAESSFSCSSEALFLAVISGCDRIDLANYEEQWALHPFPTHQVARLRLALSR